MTQLLRRMDTDFYLRLVCIAFDRSLLAFSSTLHALYSYLYHNPHSDLHAFYYKRCLILLANHTVDMI